jgi:hypothetical protein
MTEQKGKHANQGLVGNVRCLAMSDIRKLQAAPKNVQHATSLRLFVLKDLGANALMNARKPIPMGRMGSKNTLVVLTRQACK